MLEVIIDPTYTLMTRTTTLKSSPKKLPFKSIHVITAQARAAKAAQQLRSSVSH